MNHKRRTESGLTVYPNMTAEGSSSAKQPQIVVHWYVDFINIIEGALMRLAYIRLEKSRAQRIVWLLEELGLEYELKTYKRTAGYLAPPELRAVCLSHSHASLTHSPTTKANPPTSPSYRSTPSVNPRSSQSMTSSSPNPDL